MSVHASRGRANLRSVYALANANAPSDPMNAGATWRSSQKTFASKPVACPDKIQAFDFEKKKAADFPRGDEAAAMKWIETLSR